MANPYRKVMYRLKKNGLFGKSRNYMLTGISVWIWSHILRESR